jgi:hypothetical protein
MSSRWAFGTKVIPFENTEFGVAYEIPVTSNLDNGTILGAAAPRQRLIDGRLTVDFIVRY